MNGGWRAFVGVDLSDGWSYLDLVTDWGSAQVMLVEALRPYLIDECSDCREQGREALARLRGKGQGEAFWAEVDGQEFSLTPVEALAG